ncbi:hypothetical protein OPV22_033403 [Ensete ventricosum]|uniref:SMP-30/Gluconolactonase/LRE-like region domain-containing protein n=1 Tax=Ensete ventricosum TaxID=4639 RepID=A0AAV8PY72_ENSVE|nr:hypothetical protein OPV22_033403 [Ensete ventricosum]RWW05495.1 hypothetical protein GW17_00031223 [Ensete ventricosum]RZS05062.1 hypothetical protein BHM03_00035547 [Ensete ventricosum]
MTPSFSCRFPATRRLRHLRILPFLLLLLLFALLTGSALGRGRHVIAIPAAVPSPRGLAWDSSEQHFLVGSRLSHAAVYSISDAGVAEALVSDPSSSSVAALAVDHRRRRLLIALARPAALAAYDLRSPRPHRRIFLSSLPDPSAVPGGVAVDPKTGSAFITAGSVVLKVDLDGTASVLSRSAIYGADPSSEGLGAVAHVSHGFLLVVERGGTGRIFKVDEEDGAAKEVLRKGVGAAAEGIVVRSDGGAVLARGGAGARWLRSVDGWGDAAVQDEAAVDEGWQATAVAVREGRRAYVLVTPGEEEGGEEKKVRRIEEVEWRKEGEGEMVWGFVLIGLGFAYFCYWRFQMGQLVTNLNKKTA